MAEVKDAKLVSALRQAKQQPMSFAFVAKGASDGVMMVARNKIPAKDVNEAKTESGGTKVFRGRCFEEDGKMVFEVAQEPPATLAKQLKTVIQQSAGLTMQVETRVAPGLEEEGEENETQANAQTSVPPPPPPPPQQTPQPGQQPSPAAPTDPAAARFTSRAAALTPVLQRVEGIQSPAAKDAKLAFSEANKLFRAKNYAEANETLDIVESLVKEAFSAATPGNAPPQAPNPPAPPDPGAERFVTRLKALAPIMPKAEATGSDFARQAKFQVAEGNKLYVAKKFNDANGALDRAEALLKQAFAGTAQGRPPGTPQPGNAAQTAPANPPPPGPANPPASAPPNPPPPGPANPSASAPPNPPPPPGPANPPASAPPNPPPPSPVAPEASAPPAAPSNPPPPSPETSKPSASAPPPPGPGATPEASAPGGSGTPPGGGGPPGGGPPGGGPPGGGPAVASPAELKAIDDLTALVNRTRKTIDYGKNQHPDEGVRIITNADRELAEKSAAFDRAYPDHPRKPGGIPELHGYAVSAIDELKNKALAEVRSKCIELSGHFDGTLAGKLIVGDSSDKQKKIFQDLLDFINEAEELSHASTGALGRLGVPVPAAEMNGLQESIRRARAEWESGQPRRRTTVDGPVPPTGPRESRPIPAGLDRATLRNSSGETIDARTFVGEFNTACDSYGGKIAKGERPTAEEQATMLNGIDTMLNAMYPDQVSAAILKRDHRNNWFILKANYKAMIKRDGADAANAMMTGWWWFRKKVVDTKMRDMVAKYDFVWKTAGSNALESDIDISVASHGTTSEGTPFCDYEIVDEFNREMKAVFGGEPGTVFDVNLYAEAPPPELRTAQTETEKNMEAMAEAGQDVGALMKMRRFMDWEDYVALQKQTLDEIDRAIAETEGEPKAALPKRKEFTKRQFEEADSLYQMSIYKTMGALLGVDTEDDTDEANEGQIDPLKVQEKLVAKLAEEEPPIIVPPEILADPIQTQQFIAKQMEHFEEDQDRMMAATNKLYVQTMKEVRDIEKEIKDIGDAPAEAGLNRKAALVAKLRTLQSDSVYFANEAYHTSAAFAHIVSANQVSARAVESMPELRGDENRPAREAEIKRRVKAELDKLSIPQFMQSFNEQLGDFLKDCKHYEKSSPVPGVGFIRSSKYFDRLCEAMEWIAKKLSEQAERAGTPQWNKWAADFGEIKFGGTVTPATVRAGLTSLVNLRGGKATFAGTEAEGTENFNPDAEAQAFATQKIQSIFGGGVKTLRDLAALAKQVGVQVNALLRNCEAGQKLIAKDESQYFQG